MITMRLATKHANQQNLMLSDFTGGLNTSCQEEMIADNELADVLNMEIDSNSRLLKTVQGTKTVYVLKENEDGETEYEFKSAAFDIINNALILFTDDGRIFATTNFEDVKQVGTLTGTGDVITAMWEDGLLIASGGKLQYVKGMADVETIDTSPEHCNGVYIRSGRVLIFDNTDQVLFSGVGDETNWTQDTNDPSASLFAQVGYKVGGHIVGMVNMSKDILFIKSNGMIFRLENEYPDWRISELGRNIFCKGTASYCNIVNSVLIMSDIALQQVETTQEYGDMKPTNIGSKVADKIAALPANTKLRYVPPLNQVWCIGANGYVLILDCNTNAFFQRQFNDVAVDVLSINNDVYVIKSKAVCKLDANSFEDDDKPLLFKVKMKTRLSNHNFLLKRVTVCVTPLQYVRYTMSHFDLGSLRIPVPHLIASSYVSEEATQEIFQNDEQIAYRNNKNVFAPHSPKLADGFEEIYNSKFIKVPTQPLQTIRRIHRVVYRSPHLQVTGVGKGYPFILNFINIDITEV